MQVVCNGRGARGSDFWIDHAFQQAKLCLVIKIATRNHTILKPWYGENRHAECTQRALKGRIEIQDD